MKATTFVFPHEKPTKINGIPTHDTLQLLRKELYANAYGNDCTLGGGNNGYLGMIMPTDMYLKLQTDMKVTTPVEFKIPKAPEATAEEAIMIKTSKIILDCKTMETYLTQQILAAIDREYFDALDDDNMGLSRVTAKDMLAYVTKKHDVITYDELSTNRAKLDENWDPSEPIHRLWRRTQQVQRFAAAGHKPIDDDTVMHALLNVLKQTGVFTTHITIWKQKPTNTWALTAFQEFFEEADKERNLHTAKEAGYANTATTGIKTATSANAATPTTNTTHDKTVMLFGDLKVYYCWSHGGGTNAKHTSNTCNRPKPGHMNLATWDNTCGGCTDMLISQQNKNNRFRNNGSNNYNGNNSNNGNNNGNNNNVNNSNRTNNNNSYNSNGNNNRNNNNRNNGQADDNN